MLRPATTEDAEAVVRLMDTVWGIAPGATEVAALRVRHLASTDPGGAWVSVDGDGGVDGVALALVREGVWGLSLLIVDPSRQSGGIGRALMEHASAYGANARGGIIMASDDARALRTYWRAGYALRPSFDVKGTIVRRPQAPAAVREARWPQDRDLVDATSRHVRTAAHGADIDALLAAGARLLVHDGGGFCAFTPDRSRITAAVDERIARALLDAQLAQADDAFAIDFLDARQQWAMDAVLTAGLTLVPAGAICVRCETGPMAPYLPSGAYL